MTLRAEIYRIIENEPLATRMLELARLYARIGWHVFPIATNGKVPAIAGGHGHLDATTKADDHEAWWGEHPDWNIGISCGPSGLVVLDPDTYKDGVPERWARLSAERGMIETFVVATPRGGSHYYLRRNGIGFGSGEVETGIDCKAVGGYVVAPGSMIDGKLYLPLTDDDVANVPATWVDALPRMNSKSKASDDQRQKVALDLYEIPKSGDGHRTMVALVGKLRNVLPRETTLPVVWAQVQAWNSSGDRRQIEQAEVRKAVDDMYAKSPVRVLTEYDRDQQTEQSALPKDGGRLDIFTAVRDGEEVEDVPFMMHDENGISPWVEGDVNVLSGDGEAGKSMTMLGMALAMSTGTKFADRFEMPRPYRLLYLDGENNARNIKRRIPKLANGTPGLRDAVLALGDDIPFEYRWRGGLTVDTPEGRQAIIDLCLEHGAEVLVLDTQIRFTAGDLSNAKDAAALYGHLQEIMAATGLISIFMLAHLRKRQGKDGVNDIGQRLFGSIDIRNSCDTHVGLIKDIGETEQQVIHEKTRWEFKYPQFAIALEHLDGDSMRLVASPVVVSITGTVDEMLHAAGETGVLRKALVARCGQLFPCKSTENINRSVSRCLKSSSYASKTEGNAKRYWTRMHAPEDATPGERMVTDHEE